MNATVPVAEGLWTVDDDARPHLLGSRCAACGTTAFPAAGGCAKCTGDDMESIVLPTSGTLWSWTIQGFLPKNPPYAGKESHADFIPYGVGYVELPGACIVESRLTENRPEHLVIGMPLELVLIPFTTDAAGNDVLTFAFAPVVDRDDDGMANSEDNAAAVPSSDRAVTGNKQEAI